MSREGEAFASSPGVKHDPVEMTYVGRTAAKHTYSNRSRKNVWYEVYQCPHCGDKVAPLANTLRGRKKKFSCDGVTRFKRRASQKAREMEYIRTITQIST